jgi:ElaB/YqjD/DUF883 family membrane-anchored ribosome-binding protein
MTTEEKFKELQKIFDMLEEVVKQFGYIPDVAIMKAREKLKQIK